MAPAVGIHRNERARKPDSRRLRKISEPIRPGSRLAPTTATTRGSKNRRSDAVAAVRARAAEAAASRAVGSSDSVTCQVPCSISRVWVEAGLHEHVHHLPVLTTDEGLEAVQSARARDLRQTLEQPRAEPAALKLVRDGKRHFRPVRPRWIGVVAGNADQPPPRSATRTTWRTDRRRRTRERGPD